MTDANTPGAPEETESLHRVEPVDIQVEMQRSYLDYAMSVIVGRALPDVRDGLKPVHRRILYAMYDGGYRPDRGYFKCARVVGDVMGNYHPHGDSAIYDALVRLAQRWSMRMPLIDGNGNFGSPGNDPAAAMRYTECKLENLAMEMVRDIDKETVDFSPNYDGKTAEPDVLPSRFPNLLVNGSNGIAVGMATNIPPHNLREVADGVNWYLDHPEVSDEDLLDALIGRIKGPDFPTNGLVVGKRGIEDAYRTGRGSITMRAVVEVEEDRRGRQCLVVTELPYQVNPDNLALKIAELVKDGKVTGIADVKDETSGRTGQRLVIVLKRDAVAKIVLNNLYKHTQLQETFGANMLALVDGVPRTLRLDQFVRTWVAHQIEVIVRRTRYMLRKAEERAHILRALLKAIDRIDEVIALIRASASADEAKTGLMACWRSTTSRPARSSTCSSASSPRWRRGRSPTSTTSSWRRSPTTTTSSPRLSASAASSATSSPRSCRSSATSAARRSSRPRVTCAWRTSSPRRTSSSRSPAAATPSAPGSTTTGRRSAAARACGAPSSSRTTSSSTSS